MFCRDSKLLVMEKLRRQFCIGPYRRFAIRLLLRSAATDNMRIYTVNSDQTACSFQTEYKQSCKCLLYISLIYI